MGNNAANRSSNYWIILLTLTALALGWVLAYRQTAPPVQQNPAPASSTPVVSGAIATAAFGDNIIFNAAAGNSIKLTLRGNVSASAIANPRNGQYLMLLVCQDEVGGWQMSWPENVRLAGGGLTVWAEPNHCDSITIVYDGMHWLETARAQQIANPPETTSEPSVPATDDRTRESSAP